MGRTQIASKAECTQEHHLFISTKNHWMTRGFIHGGRVVWMFCTYKWMMFLRTIRLTCNPTKLCIIVYRAISCSIKKFFDDVVCQNSTSLRMSSMRKVWKSERVIVKRQITNNNDNDCLEPSLCQNEWT